MNHFVISLRFNTIKICYTKLLDEKSVSLKY